MVNKYLKKILHTIKSGKYFLFPSSFSFYMLFAIVPAFTCLELLLNVLNVDNSILFKYIYAFLPDSSSNELVDFLSQTPTIGDGINIIITFIVSMFVISRGLFMFMNVSKTLYAHKDDMNITKKIIYSMFLAVSFIFSLFMIVILDFLLSSFINDYNEVFSLLKYLLIFIVLMFSLTLLYHLGSNKRVKLKNSYLGALIASLGITLSLFLFNIYTVYLVNYNSTYGPLSWLIILLVLFRIISTFIYVGLIINVINYKEKRLVVY